MCAYRAGALELQAIRGSSRMHLAGASRAVPRPQVVSKPAGPHRLRRLAPLGPRLERQGHAEREPSREALYTPTMSVVIPKQREARYSANVLAHSTV